MIVDNATLQQKGLLDALPIQFRELKEREKYVFIYSYSEESLTLAVHDSIVTTDMKMSAYRSLKDKQRRLTSPTKIGYFSYQNDTREGLFYVFLRSYNDHDAVEKFFADSKVNDEAVDLNVSTDAFNDITSYDDFLRVMSYFSPERMQIIGFIYDLVNSGYKNRFSKPLYGSTLTRVVNMIKYDAGILPELGGTMRFMVVGEKAELTKDEKESLKKAQELLRSNVDVSMIYLKTGWAFSQDDGRWRTNISDEGAYISDKYLYDVQGQTFYIPEGANTTDVIQLIGSPQKIFSQNYYGKLSDVLVHPELYEKYPSAAELPLIYYKNDNYPSENNSFYFSPAENGGYILIRGNEQWGTHLSILLHEVQHYIQNLEGFARGGNQRIAEFVASVGAESVRSIFASIDAMKTKFIEYFDDNAKRNELIYKVEQYQTKSAKGSAYKKVLLEHLKDEEVFKNQKSTINFFLVSLIAYDKDISDNDLVDYLLNVYGGNELLFYDLWDNIVEGNKKADKYEQVLKSQGLSDNEIRQVLHSNYENLYGEIESRSVQASRRIGGVFRNYFYMTGWEKEPNAQVTVIDGKALILDVDSVKCALETKDDKYVLHFNKHDSCVPYLHELGHIVHDAMRKLGHGDTIVQEFEGQLNFKDVDEMFVANFLAYLRDNIDNDNLQSDLKSHRLFTNPVISKLLDEFLKDSEVDIMLDIIRELLSIDI